MPLSEWKGSCHHPFYDQTPLIQVNNFLKLFLHKLYHVVVRYGRSGFIKLTPMKWPTGSSHIRSGKIYRWWLGHAATAAGKNLQLGKFWWIQLFTPTSYDCAGTGRQLLQSVTSNNANNSNEQHLQQIIPTPLKTGLSWPTSRWRQILNTPHISGMEQT